MTAMIPASAFLIPCGDCSEAVQVQITKSYTEAMGMANQTLISKVRGSWNMHCHKTRSSVTRASRNVTVTSLHISQVIQQPR